MQTKALNGIATAMCFRWSWYTARLDQFIYTYYYVYILLPSFTWTSVSEVLVVEETSDSFADGRCNIYLTEYYFNCLCKPLSGPERTKNTVK